MSIHPFIRAFRFRVAAAMLAGCAGATALAQPDPAPQPPPSQGVEGRRPRQPLTREEIRTRLRQFLDQRAAQMRRDQEDIERAMRMLDEGKTIEEVQAAFPDRPGRQGGARRGGGGGRDSGWIAEWLRAQEGDGPSAGAEGAGRPGAGGGGPDRPAERDPNQPLTSEERETIRDFIKSTAPHMLGPLDELEQRDPPMAERKYRDMLRKTRMLQELRKRDRAMYDLRLADIKAGREAIEAARAIARLDAGDAALEKHSEALRAALEAQFMTRDAIRRHELARWRERITDGEKDLASRESRREQLISESMSKLVDSERRRLEGRDGDPGDNPRAGRQPRDDHGPPMRGPRDPRSGDDASAVDGPPARHADPD